MSILEQLNALQLNNEPGFIHILTSIQDSQVEMMNMLKNLEKEVFNLHVEISELSWKAKSEETKGTQDIHEKEHSEEPEEIDDYFNDPSSSNEDDICMFGFIDSEVLIIILAYFRLILTMLRHRRVKIKMALSMLFHNTTSIFRNFLLV